MKEFKFKKNYIQEVLFRVDFRTIPELVNINANIDKFINIIKDEFKILDENSINPNLWAYFDENYSKRIELTTSSIVISYNGKNYRSHKVLLEDIEKIITILNSYGVVTVNRIGLRYVNEINPLKPIENFDDWINPILHNFNSIDDNLKLMRTLTQSEFKVGDYILNFTYGEFNSNYPSINIENDFVLDYDCYTSSLTEVDFIINKFEEIHDIIKSCFKKSIGKCLIEDMEGED